MTEKDVSDLGYKVVWAGPFEVGLVKNGRGIRTWWAKDFGGELPPLNHSLVLEAVFNQEKLEAWMKNPQKAL